MYRPRYHRICDARMSVYMRDMKAVDVDIDTKSGDCIAADRTKRSPETTYQDTEDREGKLLTVAADKQARAKEGSNSIRP